MNEDLFGSIKQTITETAGAVGKKTEEFVETQKMRNKVRTLQREIRKKYADVGEIVYKRYVDGDTMDEELAGHCEVVMGLQKELAECKESMAAKQGKNVCPACGISNPKDAVFCMYCGTELPGEEEEKEEEWFTQGCSAFSVLDYRGHRRHHRRCVLCHRRLCHCRCLCTGACLLLPLHQPEEPVEDHRGLCQDVRHGGVPCRRFQHSGLGHGLFADPGCCGGSPAEPDQQ